VLRLAFASLRPRVNSTLATEMDEKTRHELEVFAEFNVAVGLISALDETPEPRSPPEPDIFVKSRSRPRYVELGRLLDAEHSRTILRALQQAPNLVTPNTSKLKLPEREMLRQKLSKTYKSYGLPIELLLYFDTQKRHLEGGLPPMPFPMHAGFVMVPLLKQSMGAFSRVWVYERYDGSVLWSYP
jgi:hypothetical protein